MTTMEEDITLEEDIIGSISTFIMTNYLRDTI